MSVPSRRTIESEIKKLRAIIKSDDDPVVTRIAYAVENALRWSIEDTKDWKKPSEDVFGEAQYLKKDLQTADK
jgi:hypothetical protein